MYIFGEKKTHLKNRSVAKSGEGVGRGIGEREEGCQKVQTLS